MPYRFKRKENVPQAVRRIVAEQAARAARELGGVNPDIHDGVHNARKCFKKIRSILRLVRHAIGEDTYKAENSWFRQAAHRLAGARDAEALLETHDKLAEHKPALAKEPLAPLRENLVSRREQIITQQQDLTEITRDLARELEEVLARIDQWRFRKKGFKTLKNGLTDSYTRGRKEFRKAIKKPDDDRFHEWRKRVKDYWYHTRLLRQLWPDLMDARARQLKRLSDMLGDDHDLSIMLATLKQEEESLGPGAPILSALANRRQQKLRDRSETLGCRIYAMDPDCAMSQMQALWSTWERGRCN